MPTINLGPCECCDGGNSTFCRSILYPNQIGFTFTGTFKDAVGAPPFGVGICDALGQNYSFGAEREGILTFEGESDLSGTFGCAETTSWLCQYGYADEPCKAQSSPLEQDSEDRKSFSVGLIFYGSTEDLNAVITFQAQDCLQAAFLACDTAAPALPVKANQLWRKCFSLSPTVLPGSGSVILQASDLPTLSGKTDTFPPGFEESTASVEFFEVLP